MGLPFSARTARLASNRLGVAACRQSITGTLGDASGRAPTAALYRADGMANGSSWPGTSSSEVGRSRRSRGGCRTDSPKWPMLTIGDRSQQVRDPQLGSMALILQSAIRSSDSRTGSVAHATEHKAESPLIAYLLASSHTAQPHQNLATLNFEWLRFPDCVHWPFGVE